VTFADSSVTPVVNFLGINGSFAINGAGSGLGDRDVLTVLAVSNAGMGSGLGETVSSDGRDTITASDTLVTISNAALGTLRSVVLAQTNGAVTFRALVVRGGSEPAPFGDTFTATPSSRLNVFVDGMDPHAGDPGDSLRVLTTGPRTIYRNFDSELGPVHARIAQADGASVGWVHIEHVADVGLAATGTLPGGPAEVQAMDTVSHLPRFAVAPFVRYTGGLTVATGDLNGDAIPDIVIGTATAASQVIAYDGISGTPLLSFFSYPGFSGGVNVAIGDVDGDGIGDIITGTADATSHVKVFNGSTGALMLSFLAYPGFSGGVNVATGDVDGDGAREIITATASVTSHVEVFSVRLGFMLSSFVAFPGFPGGISVAAGDVDGDHRADIIVGVGVGGPPHVMAYDLQRGPLAVASFFVNEPFYPPQVKGFPQQSGINVGVADINNDDLLDILVAKRSGASATLFSFNALPLAQLDAYFVYGPLFARGLFVGGSF